MKKVIYGNRETKNRIIKGDSYKVLDKLKPELENKIKCIYIDPPYNNKDNYEHYSDNKSHEEWLNEMENILIKLYPFLKEDGSIWISIDDSEMHYLKVLADKIFGRKNFASTIIWNHRTTRENRNIFSNNHEYILVYSKNIKEFKKSRNLLSPTEEQLSRYKNYDNDERGIWQSVSLNVQAGHAVKSQFYTIVAPNGKEHAPPKGRCWVYNEERMKNEILQNNIWFGKDGNGVPRKKKFLDINTIGITPETLWLAEDVGTTKQAKEELLKNFPDEKIFDTPKPERLLKRIFEIATNENDMILDCFLGTGTSVAVAEKLNRNYIGIEKGEQIETYVLPRLNKIISTKEEKGFIYIVESSSNFV